MKITEIRVSSGRTINIGNFNSRKYELWIVAELRETDDFDQCYQELLLDLEAKLDLLEHQAKHPKAILEVAPVEVAPVEVAPVEAASERERETALETARSQIKKLIAQQPKNNLPSFSANTRSKLNNTITQRGFTQGQLLPVSSELLDRSLESSHMLKEHQAAALVIWLSNLSNLELINKIWPI